MGINVSQAAQNGKLAVQKNVNAPESLISPDLTEADPYLTMKSDLKVLLWPLKAIPHKTRMRAIYNYSHFSTPVVTSQIKLPNAEEITIKYSQIAISRFGKGRVLCIGHISVLISCTPDREDYVIFLEKVLRWSGGPKPTTRMLCMLNVDEVYHDTLKNNMEGLGYGIYFEERLENYSNNSIILIQSNYEYDERIIEFVNSGGGLIVVGVDDTTLKINKILSKFGLNFLEVPHEFVDDNSKDDIIPQKEIKQLQDAGLDTHIRVFQQLYQEKLDALDAIDLLSKIIIQEIHSSRAITISYARDILEIFGPILKDIQQKSGKIYGNSRISIILTNLVVQCLVLMPINIFQNYDFSSRFVGRSMSPDCEKISVNLVFNDSGWFQTGAWLQPGYKCQIIFETRVPACEVIVGCHTFNAINNSPPWKRFPLISFRKRVSDRIFDVSTPYGGMIFIKPLSLEKIDTKPVKVSLSDVVHYPIVSVGKTESAKNIIVKEIPWGEYVTKNCVFCCRTEHIIQIDNCDAQMAFIDGLIGNVINYSGYTDKRKFRIVFDIEFPQRFTNDYPITLDLNLVKILLHSRVCSQELFDTIARVSYLAVADVGFDDKLHLTVAYFVTFCAFFQTFGNEEARKMKCDSPGYSEMVTYLATNVLVFTRAMMHARKAKEKTPTDEFLTSLEVNGGISLNAPELNRINYRIFS